MKPQRASHGMLWRLLAASVEFGALYFIHIFIARVLGSAEYGLFGILISIIVWIRVFMCAGVLTALTRFLPDKTYYQKDVFLKAFRLQAFLAILFSSLVFLLANPISRYLKAPELAGYFIIFSLDTLFYAMMALGITTQQALRFFRESAITASLYSVLRVAFVILAVALGSGLTGICVAHLAAVTLIACPLIRYLQKNLGQLGQTLKGKLLPYKVFLRYSAYQVGFALMLNFIFVSNLILTKRLVADDAWIGYYVAVNAIAKIPYMIAVIALLDVILPITVQAYSNHNESLVFHYAKQAFKFFLVIYVPFGIALAITGKKLLGFVYTPEFEVIHRALNLYYWGVAGFSGIHLITYFLYAKGKLQAPFFLILLLFFIHIFFVYMLVPSLGVNGAAVAFFLTGTTGFCFFLIGFTYEIRFPLPWLSIIKILAAAGIMGILIRIIPGVRAWLVLRYLAGGAVYFISLCFLRVITPEDIASFLRKSDASPSPPPVS